MFKRIANALLPLLFAPGGLLLGAPASAIPVLQDQNDRTQPDWTQISFSTLDPIQASGALQAPQEVIQTLGYDPSLTWAIGQTPDQFMRLGDFAEAFQWQQLKLSEIETHSGTSLTRYRLGELPLVGQQSLGQLMVAIPGLRDRRVGEVAPIAELLRRAQVEFEADTQIATVLQDASVSGLSLNQIKLDRYPLKSLPGIEQARLSNFEGWERSLISQVPGLNQVPFGQMPLPLGPSRRLALIDVVYGPAEANRTNTISGSIQAGFQVPCQRNCAHLELGQPDPGVQWIAGDYHQVEGGEKLLKQVNNGQEPAGRHPFGSAFKVVVEQTNESTGSAQTVLYFRSCQRFAITDLGCTPYFIGPIPFLPVKEGDYIPL